MPRKQKWNEKESGKIKFRCGNCKKEIWRYPSDKQGKRLFCGQKCYTLSGRGTRITSENYKDHLIKEFWKRVDKTPGYGPKGDCWKWLGEQREEGYGRLYSHFERRKIIASRFSYEIHNGEFDDSLCVCHTCDNPPCTNPQHLFLGTATDNAQDRVRKGRQKAKCSDYDVYLIRYLFNGLSTKKLQEKFDLSYQAMKMIKKFKTYPEVLQDTFTMQEAIINSDFFKRGTK